jgi:ubiquinone/menaquinone biosynthesis C-methylase UbiE
MAILYILLGIVALILLVNVVWHFASRRYALPCPTWLGWMVELENPFLKAHSAKEIIRALELRPGMTVLDFGCGPGRLSVPAGREVGPQGGVTAVDIQPGMLARAQERAKTAGVSNIRFVQAAAGEGKLGRGHFDRAMLVTVLGEIPDRAAALREIHAALKADGFLSVTEVIADPHFQSAGAVRRLAAAAGFREKGFSGNRFAYTINLEKGTPDRC